MFKIKKKPSSKIILGKERKKNEPAFSWRAEITIYFATTQTDRSRVDLTQKKNTCPLLLLLLRRSVNEDNIGMYYHLLCRLPFNTLLSFNDRETSLHRLFDDTKENFYTNHFFVEQKFFSKLFNFFLTL